MLTALVWITMCLLIVCSKHSPIFLWVSVGHYQPIKSCQMFTLIHTFTIFFGENYLCLFTPAPKAPKKIMWFYWLFFSKRCCSSPPTAPCADCVSPSGQGHRYQWTSGWATSIRGRWVMESSSDNDHQHCKQWPINIPWQVVKCQNAQVGAGRAFLREDLCVHVCVFEHVRVYVFASTYVQGSEQWWGRPPRDDMVVPGFRRASAHFKSSLPLFSLSIFPLKMSILSAFCFIRSLAEVRPKRRVYIHLFLLFNENSHSAQEAGNFKPW